MSSRYPIRVRIAVPGILLFAAATIACGALIGPATEKTDAYYLHCGDELCDPLTYQCTRDFPVRCAFYGSSGMSRDAGRE